MKRGGRKEIQLSPGARESRQIDDALIKALARAFSWRKMLEEGAHATIEEIARARGMDATYLSRILRLTLLAPDIVEAILDGRQSAGLRLDDLLKALPLKWKDQVEAVLAVNDV